MYLPSQIVCGIAAISIGLGGLACREHQEENKATPFTFNETDVESVGPFQVGVKTIELVGLDGQTLLADIWYPAIIEETDDLAIYEPTITVEQHTGSPEPQNIQPHWLPFLTA